jgi:hypothetical protein
MKENPCEVTQLENTRTAAAPFFGLEQLSREAG